VLRFSSRLTALADLFVTTSFTLPQRKGTGWIRATLVDGAIRRNDFAAATRANTPPCRLSFNVQCQRIIVTHLVSAADKRELTRIRKECLSAFICVHPWLLYRFKTMKIVQKIETGGTNSTTTPMLKLRMNFAFVTLVNEARHIEHCASA
jgi:hypothetical protein